MFFATLFQSISQQGYNDINHAMNLFFSRNGGAIKAMIIGNLIYLISQSFDVLIYSKLKVIVQTLNGYGLETLDLQHYHK